jgi:hypothetical protein
MKRLTQNQWALKNLKPEERMTCAGCGNIVARDWMYEEFEENVGEFCGPCYRRRQEAFKTKPFSMAP